jgi:2,5-furandicarboxylate decarboxylase 1
LRGLSARPDLRSFLAERHAAGDHVLTMSAGVSPELELSAMVKYHERPTPPLMLFPDVGGSGVPVAVGLCATRERLAAAIGADDSEMVRSFRRRTAVGIASVVVADAPVQARVETAAPDLGAWPFSTHVPGQGGPYLTAALGVVRHTEGGPHNLGIYRLMVRGRRELSVSTPPHSDLGRTIARARQDGEQFVDFAAVIGHHPALHLASQARNGPELDSYDVAGSLLRAPLAVTRAKTVDLLIPADAEVVIEGRIDVATTVAEGPFAEFSGYLAPGEGHPVAVSAITSRARPVLQDIHPVHREHLCLFGHPAREIAVLSALESAGIGVTSVRIPDDTAGMWVYVAMPAGSHDGAAAARIAVSADPILKAAIAVGSDVDLTRHDEVLSVTASRAAVAEHVALVPGARSTRFDPSARGAATVTKLAIDATGADIAMRVAVPAAARKPTTSDWKAVIG